MNVLLIPSDLFSCSHCAEKSVKMPFYGIPMLIYFDERPTDSSLSVYLSYKLPVLTDNNFNELYKI